MPDGLAHRRAAGAAHSGDCAHAYIGSGVSVRADEDHGIPLPESGLDPPHFSVALYDGPRWLLTGNLEGYNR